MVGGRPLNCFDDLSIEQAPIRLNQIVLILVTNPSDKFDELVKSQEFAIFVIPAKQTVSQCKKLSNFCLSCRT
jgi:hypothetical protein